MIRCSNLLKNFFVQSLPKFDPKDLLELQSFLSKYGGISISDSNEMTINELKIVRDKVVELTKDEKKSEADQTNAILRGMSGGYR